MNLKPAITLQLADPAAERVRRNHDERIAELQGLLMTGARLIPGIEIVSGADVTVSHGLGRAPRFVWLSAPRYRQSEIAAVNAAGTIFDRGGLDFAGNPVDRTKVIRFVAIGFATVGTVTLTFDMAVL